MLPTQAYIGTCKHRGIWDMPWGLGARSEGAHWRAGTYEIWGLFNDYKYLSGIVFIYNGRLPENLLNRIYSLLDPFYFVLAVLCLRSIHRLINMQDLRNAN